MGLRSRGLKLDFASGAISEKRYFDPVDEIYTFNDQVARLSQKMQILEYSLAKNDEIDSINFHTACQPIEEFLSIKFNSRIKNEICQIFDKSYKAYTLGLRFNNRRTVAESIYYYPTRWKGNRFGIAGLVDHDDIIAQTRRFANIICLPPKDNDILLCIASAAYKFKGLCITSNQEGSVSYKMYYRIEFEKLKALFPDLYDFDRYYSMYGDLVLMALRISATGVSGLNFYYLR